MKFITFGVLSTTENAGAIVQFLEGKELHSFKFKMLMESKRIALKKKIVQRVMNGKLKPVSYHML